jgi:hypothetical protein
MGLAFQYLKKLINRIHPIQCPEGGGFDMIAEINDGIRIQDLVLAEPGIQIRTGFDPKRDIQPADLERFKQNISSGNTLKIYIEQVGRLSYILPDEAVFKNNHSKRNIPDEIMNDFLIGGTEGNSEYYLRKLFFTKKLMPDVEISTEVFLRAKSLLSTTEDFSEQYRQLTYMYLLFPEKRPEMPITQEFKKHLMDDLIKDKDNGIWLSVSEKGAAMKVLCPEIFDKKLFSKENWESMKERLHVSSVRGAQTNFIDMAFNMYVMSADKIVYTKNGPEFVISENSDFVNQDTPLPTRKRF